jgi:lipoyl(octanoyl) transferase
MEVLTQAMPGICYLESIDLIWQNINNEHSIQYFWLGQQPYEPVWELQKKLHENRVRDAIPDVVLLLEHDHVYTFGKNADRSHLLDSKPQNADVIQIDRGGEVTYHGPGQLVCYPIIDLHDYKMSVSWYMRQLENVVIQFLEDSGIKTSQKTGLTGVWVNDYKICAMGVRLSKWVTMHGFALNINPDMSYFDGMIPCGIFEYGITSLNEQGVDISMQTVADSIVKHFDNVFIKNINEV